VWRAQLRDDRERATLRRRVDNPSPTASLAAVVALCASGSILFLSCHFLCACAEMLWMQKLGQQDAFDAVNQPDFTLRVMDQ